MQYVFADCRWSLDDPGWGREQYLAGHVPGAVFLDLDRDLSAPPGASGRHPLPSAEDFARVAGAAGIGSGTFVVAYGDAAAPSGSGGCCATSATTPAA